SEAPPNHRNCAASARPVGPAPTTRQGSVSATPMVQLPSKFQLRTTVRRHVGLSSIRLISKPPPRGCQCHKGGHHCAEGPTGEIKVGTYLAQHDRCPKQVLRQRLLVIGKVTGDARTRLEHPRQLPD